MGQVGWHVKGRAAHATLHAPTFRSIHHAFVSCRNYIRIYRSARVHARGEEEGWPSTPLRKSNPHSALPEERRRATILPIRKFVNSLRFFFSLPSSSLLIFNALEYIKNLFVIVYLIHIFVIMHWLNWYQFFFKIVLDWINIVSWCWGVVFEKNLTLKDCSCTKDSYTIISSNPWCN